MEKKEAANNTADTKKKKIIIIAVIAVVLIIAAIIFGLFWKKGYRSIKLLDMFGIVTYDRGTDIDVPVYEGMSLTAGDTMRTGGDGSYCSMMLDEDKFVYMEENSEVLFELAGRKNSSRTTLHLSKGAIINEIENPLGEKESYEVKTPNSLMAVRGTRFRVSCYVGEDGILYTRVSVFEGKVESWLIYPDGSISDESHMATMGNEILIYYDEESGITDFVKSDENGLYTDKESGKIVTPIRYAQLPRQALEYLKTRMVEDNVIYESISLSELDAVLADPDAGMSYEPEIVRSGETTEDDNIANETKVEEETTDAETEQDETDADNKTAEETKPNATATPNVKAKPAVTETAEPELEAEPEAPAEVQPAPAAVPATDNSSDSDNDDTPAYDPGSDSGSSSGGDSGSSGGSSSGGSSGSDPGTPPGSDPGTPPGGTTYAPVNGVTPTYDGSGNPSYAGYDYHSGLGGKPDRLISQTTPPLGYTAITDASGNVTNWVADPTSVMDEDGTTPRYNRLEPSYNGDGEFQGYNDYVVPYDASTGTGGTLSKFSVNASGQLVEEKFTESTPGSGVYDAYDRTDTYNSNTNDDGTFKWQKNPS